MGLVECFIKIFNVNEKRLAHSSFRSQYPTARILSDDATRRLLLIPGPQQRYALYRLALWQPQRSPVNGETTSVTELLGQKGNTESVLSF